MSLTTGDALQDHRYIIQATLSHDDHSVTYEALCSLNQRRVIVQTFSDGVKQRSDFAHLRQHFLAQVEGFIGSPSAPRLLDCFQENDQPFVVLELTEPEQVEGRTVSPSPQGASLLLNDWFVWPSSASDTSHPIHSTASQDGAEAIAPPSLTQPLTQPLGATKDRHNSPSTSSPTGSVDPVDSVDSLGLTDSTHSTSIHPADSLGATPPVVEKTPMLENSPAIAPEAANSPPPDHSSTVTVWVNQSTAKSKRQPASSTSWFLVALTMASLFAGFVGLGAGIALRMRGATTGNSSSPMGSGLFSRDQSFPAQSDWPVIAPPDLFPNPVVEQPLYRTAPPLESLQPLPSPSPLYIAPVRPSPLSDLQPLPDETNRKFVTPPTDLPPEPTAPLVPDATVPPITTTSPKPIVPAAPVAPVPEPALPATPPAVKPLSTNDPAIFKQ